MNFETSSNMDIDSLVDAFDHKTAVIWKPKLNFVRDINIIINELKSFYSFINLDIYEVLVSCGHDLTWDQEYFVSLEDLNWFRNEEGIKYFLSNVNEKNIICTIDEYNAILNIHSKLVDLFALQIEED